MAETVGIDRPPVAKPVSRPRSRRPATVSASALTLHLDCSWTYIGKLEAEGVIQQQGNGFPLDRAVLLTCDTCGASIGDHRARRPTLIRSRKRRELVRRGEVDALIEDIAGTVFSVEPACAVRAGAIESSRALCEGHLGTAEREFAKIESVENLSSPLRRGCRRTPILTIFPRGEDHAPPGRG